MPSTYIPRHVLREADALEAFGQETGLLDELEQTRTAAPPMEQASTPLQLPALKLPTWEELSGEAANVGTAMSGAAQTATSRIPSFGALNPPTPALELPTWEQLTGETEDAAMVPGQPSARPAPSPQTAGAGATLPRAPAAGGGDEVDQAALAAGVDPALFRRLVGQESGGDQGAVSNKGAAGAAQLMPETAQYLGRKYGLDTSTRLGNLTAGAHYLKEQLDAFGSVPLALAAYNAGPGAVQKYGGIPPYAETQKYVRIIGGGYSGSGRAQPATTPPESTPDAPQGPSVTQRAAESRVASGELTPNQLTAGKELSSADALAACGPAAAVAFARRNGRNPTLDEAVQLAREVGWTPAAGMAGPASQVNLLRKMGVESTLEWAADPAKIAESVQQGNPVIIDTPGHYFVAESYDPKTGKFDFGNSTRILKAAGGKTQFTLAELPGLGMGAPRATIYMQSPLPQETTGLSEAAPQTPTVSAAPVLADKGAGLSGVQALEPGPRDARSAPSPDSTFGPFDPPGYGQGPQPGDFPETPPAEVTHYPSGPRPGDFPATPPLAPTYYPGSEPTAAPEPNLVQRAGQGLGDLSRGLVSGLNQTAADIGGQFAPRTEPTAPRFETDEGPGPAAPLIAPLGGALVRAGQAAAREFPEQIQHVQEAMPTEDAPPGFYSNLPALGAAAGVIPNTVGAAINELTGGQPLISPLGEPMGAGDIAANFIDPVPGAGAMLGVGAILPKGLRSLAGRGARVAGEAASAAARAAELARPIVLSTEEQLGRLRLDKFPAELHDDLLRAAKGTNFGEGLRRGVLSDEAVQTLAAEYGPSVEQAISGGRRGRAYSAEEIVALRNLMVGQTERVRALGDVLTESQAGGQIDVVAMAQHVAEQKKLALLGDIVFGGAPAEAGRALRQFRQLAQSLEEDPMRAGLRFIQKQYGSLDKAEQAVAQYQAQVEMGADPVALTKFLRNLAQPGLVESWLNRTGIIRFGGMLSGSATHVLNTTGNAIMQGSDVATGVLGAGIDRARVAAAKAAGQPATRAIFLEETPARLVGMVSGARTGLAEAAFVMRHGFRPEEVTKLDHLRAGFGTNVPGLAPAGSARAEAADFLAEGPLRALGAADAIFRGTAMGGWTAAEATAKAMRDNGGKPAPAEAVLEAMEHRDVLERAASMASRSVLQEDTAARRFAGWVRTQPAAVQSVISQIAPFVSTPYSLVAQGVGMTPAGVVKVIGDARKGNIRGAEEQLARVALGTALMQVSDAQYLAGNLTGPRPESEAERSTLPPGWREWSFRVPTPDGQVHYVPMALAGPFAIPMVVGILKAEAGKQGQPFTPERLGETALGIGRFASDQTFLQGVSQLSAALERGGSKIETYVESIAASYSPHLAGGGALGRELQQLMGMPQRNPQGALEALEATFPYLASNVPPRRDVLGREQQTAPGGVETALLRSTAGRDEPILQVFRDAGEGLPMAAPKEVLDAAYKRRVPLDRDQQDAWRQMFGRELETRWRDAGRPRDPKTLRRIEGESRDAAAARVLGH